MSQTIQMRTTNEKTGDYRTYAAKSDTPIKGMSIHTDIVSRLAEEPDYIEIEVVEGEGAVTLEPYGATSVTVKLQSGTAVRNSYFYPLLLSKFSDDFSFEGEDTDLSGVPTLAIDSIEVTDEDTYDEETQVTSADDAADALFGDSDDSGEGDDDSEETVEVSDEELGIVEG